MKLFLYLTLGLIFFGALILAAQFFPHPYDWRWNAMSVLAEPRSNPRAYFIACTGLALSGLLLFPFAALLRTQVGTLAPNTARWAGRLLIVGAIFLMLAALVPGHLTGLGRTHEHFAQLAGAALCLSMMFYLSALLRLPQKFAAQRIVGVILVFGPATALVAGRLALAFADKFLARAAYLALKTSIWNSLALWEWIGAVGVYIFLGMLLTLPKTEKEFR